MNLNCFCLQFASFLIFEQENAYKFFCGEMFKSKDGGIALVMRSIRILLILHGADIGLIAGGNGGRSSFGKLRVNELL